MPSTRCAVTIRLAALDKRLYRIVHIAQSYRQALAPHLIRLRAGADPRIVKVIIEAPEWGQRLRELKRLAREV